MLQLTEAGDGQPNMAKDRHQARRAGRTRRPTACKPAEIALARLGAAARYRHAGCKHATGVRSESVRRQRLPPLPAQGCRWRPAARRAMSAAAAAPRPAARRVPSRCRRRTRSRQFAGLTVQFDHRRAFLSGGGAALIGHIIGMRIHDTQPAKLAAFELAPVTESLAPLKLGGVLVDGEVRWALAIPRLGSIIARNSLDAPAPRV